MVLNDTQLTSIVLILLVIYLIIREVVRIGDVTQVAHLKSIDKLKDELEIELKERIRLLDELASKAIRRTTNQAKILDRARDYIWMVETTLHNVSAYSHPSDVEVQKWLIEINHRIKERKEEYHSILKLIQEQEETLKKPV